MNEKEQQVMVAKHKKLYLSLDAGFAQPKNKFIPEGRNTRVNQAIEFCEICRGM